MFGLTELSDGSVFLLLSYARSGFDAPHLSIDLAVDCVHPSVKLTYYFINLAASHPLLPILNMFHPDSKRRNTLLTPGKKTGAQADILYTLLTRFFRYVRQNIGERDSDGECTGTDACVVQNKNRAGVSSRLGRKFNHALLAVHIVCSVHMCNSENHIISDSRWHHIPMVKTTKYAVV